MPLTLNHDGTIDAANFDVDATGNITSNGNVGIGTTSPTVSLDVSTKTDAVALPKGTQAQRPSAATGLMRYNTTGQWMEYYDGTEWVPMVFGAFLWTRTDTTASQTSSGWMNMDAVSCPDFYARPKVISVSFDGYIQSGPYYWTWRLYNGTKGQYLPPLGGYHSFSQFVASGGGITYRGGVHNMSAQPARAFDASACSTGDTIYLQMSASSGDGSILYTGSQILYSDNIGWWMGALSGKETDTFYTA